LLTPWPVLPLPSYLPATLIAVTITLATLSLFVAAIIICHMLSLFVIACRCSQVVINSLLPATVCL
jgi:hypothetical protein